MFTILLFAYPLIASLLAIPLRSKNKLDLLVILHALLSLGVGVHGFIYRGSVGNMDDLGLFVFLITALIYFAVALYRFEPKSQGKPSGYRLHSIVLMVFIATMQAASMAKDLGLIWVFVEATTLSSALLISYNKRKSSLEAAWKYLFICSVGIAPAFVGILLLVLAQPESASLVFSQIQASALSPFWLKLSFIFILVGFGTKIGLAPLHFWKPDAYHEAPSAVNALLSGALLNTALLPILRVEKIMKSAGLGTMVQDLYLLMGFISVFVAAMFMLKTRSYKRLLAYSSIENAGIIMIAFGLGGSAVYAGYLHILGHSLTKAALFFIAGNFYKLYGTRMHSGIKGILQTHKTNGWLWLIAVLMILGFPPSPLFVSKFFILSSLLTNAMYWQAALLLLLLSIIAWAMLSISLNMIKTEANPSPKRLPHLAFLSPMALIVLAAILGVLLPTFQ